jgi:hypothetical protein
MLAVESVLYGTAMRYNTNRLAFSRELVEQFISSFLLEIFFSRYLPSFDNIMIINYL